tara:strand:+ start:981 stop:1409 length:429 start_codon:yes stop_codon:yes gene_type:complete
MTNSNKKHTYQLQLIKKHIKDLSFENPQSISLVSIEKSTENINIDFSVISKPFDKDHIEVTLKIKCNCSYENKILFCLELDYLGFFKKINSVNINDDTITKEAIEHLFPSAKSIIHYISQNGGFVTISLDKLDLNNMKKINL